MINEKKSTLFFNGLSRDELEYAKNNFLFLSRDMEEGLKYLVFFLNPNDYCKVD